MSNWEEGDSAVLLLEKKLDKIIKEKISFEKKIELIGEELRKAAEPWNLKGDDRVLSMMNNSACADVEKIAEAEIEATKNSKGKIESKNKKLEKIEAEIDRISWLAKGFVSSIRVKIAFIKAGFRLKIS